MIKKIATVSTKMVLTISVFLAVLFTMAGGLKDYLAEKSARNSGALVEMHLTDNEFRKESMRSREPEKGWKATDGDPQLILEGAMMFTGIEFYMEYSVYPGEMLVYYSTAEQPEYTNANMAVVAPIKGRDGWFKVSVPATNITSLRIDPTIMAGNHMVFGEFIVSPQKTLVDHMAFDTYSVLSTMICSMVLFAILSIVKDFFTKSGK